MHEHSAYGERKPVAVPAGVRVLQLGRFGLRSRVGRSASAKPNRATGERDPVPSSSKPNQAFQLLDCSACVLRSLGLEQIASGKALSAGGSASAEVAPRQWQSTRSSLLQTPQVPHFKDAFRATTRRMSSNESSHTLARLSVRSYFLAASMEDAHRSTARGERMLLHRYEP